MEEIESVIGEIGIHPVAKAEIELNSVIARSPGMKYKHYAPKAEVILVEGKDISSVAKKIQEIHDELVSEGKKVGLMVTGECYVSGHILRRMGPRDDLVRIAQNIFKILKEFDQDRVDVIIAEGVSTRGLGLAIMNRLRRASGGNIIKL